MSRVSIYLVRFVWRGLVEGVYARKLEEFGMMEASKQSKGREMGVLDWEEWLKGLGEMLGNQLWESPPATSP
ncbi:hypothetical protein FRC00_009155, partial [Tulasnella sp. 408]